MTGKRQALPKPRPLIECFEELPDAPNRSDRSEDYHNADEPATAHRDRSNRRCALAFLIETTASASVSTPQRRRRCSKR